MWKSNKKKVIFVIFFAIIWIAITAVAIWFTILNKGTKEKQNSNTNIFNISTEITANGIGKYDTYDENALVIKDEKDKVGKCEINYITISGLKDKSLEKKINQEIKEMAYGYDYSKNPYVSSVNIYGNFSNVLSIEGWYGYGEDLTSYTQKSINYNLTNGEKLEFNELFTSESKALTAVRECAYETLAWDYMNKSQEGKEEYSEIGDISKIDYGEIEEDVNNVVWKFRNNKIDNFYFDQIAINFVINDIYYSINMKDYMDSIAIYSRYSDVSADKIYENPSIARKDLIALTYREETLYEVREEKDNYYIDMYVDAEPEYIDSEKVKNLLKEKVDKKAKEVRELNKDKNKYYIVNYLVIPDVKDDGNIFISEQTLTYICQKGDWSAIKDKLIESWRNTGEADIAPANRIYIEEDDVSSYSFEELCSEIDKNANEVVPKDQDIKNEVISKIESLVYLEKRFEVEDETKAKSKITNYWQYNLFTDEGIKVYEKNAKDKKYLEIKTIKEEDYEYKEYYLKKQDKYQFGNVDYYLNDEKQIKIDIKDKTSSKVNVSANIKFFKDEENMNKYYYGSTNEENTDKENETVDKSEYLEDYTLEIELVRTSNGEWKINNYSVRQNT